jgi:hypothetical protein
MDFFAIFHLVETIAHMISFQATGAAPAMFCHKGRSYLVGGGPLFE